MSTRVDTAFVFKQRVECFRCNDAYYFTLQAIAEGKDLTCPVCRTAIDLQDGDHEPIVRTVRDKLRAINEIGSGS